MHVYEFKYPLPITDQVLGTTPQEIPLVHANKGFGEFYSVQYVFPVARIKPVFINLSVTIIKELLVAEETMAKICQE